MKIKKHLPPYGAALASRQQFQNLPFLAVVCTGQDAWNQAKRWNSSGNNCAMVLPAGESPDKFIWPVRDCTCVIEWNAGPKPDLIIDLTRCLLLADADIVVVRPLFADLRAPLYTYDNTRALGDRWVQCRETIRVYRRAAGGQRVTA